MKSIRKGGKESEPSQRRGIKVGVIQIEYPEKINVNSQIQSACRWIDEIAKEKVGIVCLPEYWSVGPFLCGGAETMEEARRLAEPIPGPTTKILANRAKMHGIYIVGGSMVEIGKDGFLYNTSPLLGPDGKLIGKYRKAHLVPGSEGIVLKPGSDYPVFKTSFGTIGVMICYDYLFPEVARILTLKGAEVIFFCHAVGGHEERLLTILRTRAHENAVYVVGANFAGRLESNNTLSSSPVDKHGRSAIIAPTGHILADGGNYQGLVTAWVNLRWADKMRKGQGADWWRGNRRPETYGRICKP